MSSAALYKFENNFLKDVHRLIDSYEKLNPNGRGKRSLDHLTRSGIMMLCAAWERYLELLISESVKHLSDELSSPDGLPKEVRKELSNMVKTDKNELKPLELAGDGWRNIYKSHAESVTDKLNTPSSTKIDDLFLKLLGIKSLSEKWSDGKSNIDKFVIDRGAIAHKGQEARYMKIYELQEYYKLIKKAAYETDNYISEYIQSITKGKAPWYKKNIPKK